MSRRKGQIWQPNDITSIIRASQDHKGEEPSSDDANTRDVSVLCHSLNSSNSFSPESSGQSIHPNKASHGTEASETRLAIAGSSDLADINVIRSVGVTHVGHIERHGDASHSASAVIVEGSNITTQPSTEDTHRQRTVSASIPLTKDAWHTDTHQKAANSDFISRAPHLRRKSSSVRLSMSLDGKAKVVVGEETPSPPKKRSGPLQRSQSLIPFGSQIPSNGEGSSAWQRPRTHGRSRDARTWEFYCDSDARNSLTKAAELDQKGSALSVIGLIRSGSGGRKPLTPVRKENTQLKRKALGAHDGQKPKLSRTASSVARLQTTSYSKKSDPKKSEFEVEIWQDPAGDSDKENVEPGAEGAQRRAHATRPATASQRAVLQESSSIMSHSTSLGAMMDRDPTLSARRKRQVANHDKENQQEDSHALDEEVSAFMGRPKPSRGEDEMDAVQNLLSLSQGVWK
ncbi:MAG: hypothetical protein MMC23_004617 [Stictis urceolatum]|nr:hypothetical protein [Stictis urceolata]